jgi:hypothetical protein
MLDIIEIRSQHPGDVLDHAVAFGDWLEADTLATVSVVAAAGITLGTGAKAPAIAGDDVVLWLSGGTSGTSYNVAVTVTTAGGRTKVQDCRITITDPTP